MCKGPHDFIPAENVVKLELICQVSGQRVENVVHVQVSGAPTAGMVRNIAETAITAWAINIAPLIADSVQLVLVRATDVSVEDGFGYELEPGTVTTGTISNPVLPGNVTVATKFATGRIGRSQRGRAFWIGLTETQVAGNLLAPGFGTTISGAWAGFFLELGTALGTPIHVIVSYCHDNVWRELAQITEVTDYSTNEDIDSMRRRLNHRGL